MKGRLRTVGLLFLKIRRKPHPEFFGTNVKNGISAACTIINLFKEVNSVYIKNLQTALTLKNCLY